MLGDTGKAQTFMNSPDGRLASPVWRRLDGDEHITWTLRHGALKEPFFFGG